MLRVIPAPKTKNDRIAAHNTSDTVISPLMQENSDRDLQAAWRYLNCGAPGSADEEQDYVVLEAVRSYEATQQTYANTLI
jgi:hypothetical protein